VTTALGILARYQGDNARARRLLEDGLRTFRETGGIAEPATLLTQIATPLHHLGLLARSEGENDRAISLLREVLAEQQKRGDVQGIARSLEGLAGVMLARGPEHSARLFGAAEALREVIGAPRWPADKAVYESDIAKAREAVGDDAFAAAWSAGRTMSVDEAVEFALPTP